MDSYGLRCLPMTKSLSIESGCVAGRETFFSCVSISLLKHTILKFMCALKKKSSFQKMFFSCFSQVTVCVICMVMHYSITEAVLWLTVPSVTHKCVSYTIYFSVLEFLFLFLHAAEYMATFFFLKILKYALNSPISFWYALNSPISFCLILPPCFFEEWPFYSVGFLWLWLTMWTERYAADSSSR